MIVLTGSQSKGSRSTERELYPKQVKFLFAEMRREARCPWLMLRKRVRVRIPSGGLYFVKRDYDKMIIRIAM